MITTDREQFSIPGNDADTGAGNRSAEDGKVVRVWASFLRDGDRTDDFEALR